LRRLQLRGNATSAFRAPSLYESFPGFVTSIGRFTGEANVPLFRPVRLFGNSELDPERAFVWSAGLEWSPVIELGFSADYWNYDYDDRIVAEQPVQIHMNDPNDPRIDRDAGGRLTGVNTQGFNAAFARTHGIDAGAILKLDFDELGWTAGDAGVLTVAAEATYVLAFEIPRAQVPDVTVTNDPADPDDDETVEIDDCDAEACDVAGRRNYATSDPPMPRLRVNVPVTYAYDDHVFNFVVHYIGGYEDDGAPDPETGAFPDVDPFLTLDFTYGYTFRELIGESTTLRVGVRNLTDADPPFVDTTNGYDYEIHDPRGRLLYAKLTQEF
jgi:iron complex outermembrane recepter protein